MSATKKNLGENKVRAAAHEAIRSQYPHIPVRLLPYLDEAMRFTNCREASQSIERLFELAMFKAGAHEGLDEKDCDALVDAHALMKAFREAAYEPVDPLRVA